MRIIALGFLYLLTTVDVAFAEPQPIIPLHQESKNLVNITFEGETGTPLSLSDWRGTSERLGDVVWPVPGGNANA